MCEYSLYPLYPLCTYTNACIRNGIYVEVKLKAFNEIDDDDAVLFFKVPIFYARSISCCVQYMVRADNVSRVKRARTCFN